jgi:hypothetical protein
VNAGDNKFYVCGGKGVSKKSSAVFKENCPQYEFTYRTYKNYCIIQTRLREILPGFLMAFRCRSPPLKSGFSLKIRFEKG